MFVYRALLYLFPASWRAEYGAAMCAVFARRLNDAGGFFGRLWVCMEALADLLTTAPAVQWDLVRQDVRYAFRTLRRTPGFAVAATAIAAMGIGTAAVESASVVGCSDRQSGVNRGWRHRQRAVCALRVLSRTASGSSAPSGSDAATIRLSGR